MKNTNCTRCHNKFKQKDIYTIQQFQYRQKPDYNWTIKFLQELRVDEWDSLCEQCTKYYAKISEEAWKKVDKK